MEGGEAVLAKHALSDGGQGRSHVGGTAAFQVFERFSRTAEVEVARGEHFANAREYRAYLQMLRGNREATFLCHHSVKFKDSAQLVELGLMATSKATKPSSGIKARLRPLGGHSNSTD